MSKYAHHELNHDIAAPAGYYTPKKEVRLKYNGREVLYIVNQTVIDSSCCNPADFTSALVPGYIVRWQEERNKNGIPVSIVEPIDDKQTQDKIRRFIQETEHISQTEFW